MIDIKETHYQFSHGKAPEGHGLWGFDVTDLSTGHEETIFVSHPMTYDDARKWVRSWVNQHSHAAYKAGYIQIQVAP